MATDVDAMAVCLDSCEQYPNCTHACTIEAPFPWSNLLFTVVLVMLSGMFSGLTLGLLSLSLEGLDIVIHGGNPDERRWATRIYPVRKRGNLLLCTLLFGNTLVIALPPLHTHQPTQNQHTFYIPPAHLCGQMSSALRIPMSGLAYRVGLCWVGGTPQAPTL